jgi:hypothetical protein
MRIAMFFVSIVALSLSVESDDKHAKKRPLTSASDHVMTKGQKIKITPMPAQLPVDKDKEDWDSLMSDYVANPANPNATTLPKPKGLEQVRRVLNHWKPVPQDRIDYFKPLETDPLSADYPLAA